MSLFPLQFRLQTASNLPVGGLCLSRHAHKRGFCVGCSAARPPAQPLHHPLQPLHSSGRKPLKDEKGGREEGGAEKTEKERNYLKSEKCSFINFLFEDHFFYYRAPQGYKSKVCMFIHLINDLENSLCLVSASSTVN